MSEAVAAALPARPNLNTRPHVAGGVIFVVLLAIGVGYTLNGLLADIDAAHTPPVAIGAFVLLGIALLIALGFEFVNGFHDTANAVATVIYTHSLPPHAAVVWSGAFNFLGVMVSSGAVAFSVLSLLPVELILQVGGSAGFAMIFALLLLGERIRLRQSLGILLLLSEVIKGARPGAKYLTDHLLSLIVFGAAAAEFVLWPKFGTSTYFLLTLLSLTDFLSGLALRTRRGAAMASIPAVSKKGAQKTETPAAERTGPVS